MANGSALAYQLGHGTVGVPLIIPTKAGQRCGHYARIGTGFRFVRDPNVVCGLPTKSVSSEVIQACVNNSSLCQNATLPAGVQQVGSTPITGTGQGNERLGNLVIR